ncbi:general bacterial porin domain protein [Burkholderia cenocepacia BC7]|nr:porin [Burkholderia cenocepacia]ERI27263.1 general bacterial porin domain protein [Burkholderia cenocepacia BC7]
MKKALVAAALMAAGVVTAHAQSSVTLYGRLDAGLEYLNGLQNGHQVRAESGDWGTSLWGLKGSEDIGGGNKILFHLEGAFNTMNGGFSGSIWDRFATVGISNDRYGTLLLG